LNFTIYISKGLQVNTIFDVHLFSRALYRWLPLESWQKSDGICAPLFFPAALAACHKIKYLKANP
jgi:hypothetical protein